MAKKKTTLDFRCLLDQREKIKEAKSITDI